MKQIGLMLHGFMTGFLGAAFFLDTPEMIVLKAKIALSIMVIGTIFIIFDKKK